MKERWGRGGIVGVRVKPGASRRARAEGGGGGKKAECWATEEPEGPAQPVLSASRPVMD